MAVAASENSPEQRRYAKVAEEVFRNSVRMNPVGMLTSFQSTNGFNLTHDLEKRGRVTSEPLVKTILEVRIHWALRMNYKELNQILRIAYRKRAEQDSINERKNPGGRCYSYGYQHRSDCEKAGRAAEAANSISEVLNH